MGMYLCGIGMCLYGMGMCLCGIGMCSYGIEIRLYGMGMCLFTLCCGGVAPVNAECMVCRNNL